MKCYVSTFAISSIALVLGLVPSYQANADLAIQFSLDNGLSFDSEVRLLEGDTANIEVYLTDSDINGPIAGLQPGEGLLQFELFLEGDTNFSTITDAALVFPYGGDSDVVDNSFTWDAFNLVAPTPGSQTLLGNFDIVANSQGPTVFTAGDSDLNNVDWLVGSSATSQTIEQALFGANGTDTFNFTVVAVPEPSSILVGLGCVALAATRRRRRS